MGKINTSFFQKVYEVVYQIPYGRVSTYGAIAHFLGTSRAARMVGWAMNASHNITPQIPAHRVVNRIGLLSGKAQFSSPKLMQQLLESEGIKIKDDKILNFKQVFWDPSNELKAHNG